MSSIFIFGGLILLAAMAAGILWFLRGMLKDVGRLEAEKEAAEREAAIAKRANRIQAEPDVAWAEFIKRLRDKAK